MGGLSRYRAIDGQGWQVIEMEVMPTGDTRAGIEALCARVFDVAPAEALGRLVGKARIHVAVATLDKRVVGCKMGYERKPGCFESWLGAVDPGCRRRGIAGELMRRQHAWCRARGYASIRTRTSNRWRAMLILNLRHGFDVIGAYTDKRGEPKLILELDLE